MNFRKQLLKLKRETQLFLYFQYSEIVQLTLNKI